MLCCFDIRAAFGNLRRYIAGFLGPVNGWTCNLRGGVWRYNCQGLRWQRYRNCRNLLALRRRRQPLGFLFLDLLAAESLVVLVSSIIPIFVVALAITAFANGLWMSADGFMVKEQTLNVFWRYVFHYIDYQA